MSHRVFVILVKQRICGLVPFGVYNDLSVIMKTYRRNGKGNSFVCSLFFVQIAITLWYYHFGIFGNTKCDYTGCVNISMRPLVNNFDNFSF